MVFFLLFKATCDVSCGGVGKALMVLEKALIWGIHGESGSVSDKYLQERAVLSITENGLCERQTPLRMSNFEHNMENAPESAVSYYSCPQLNSKSNGSALFLTIL